MTSISPKTLFHSMDLFERKELGLFSTKWKVKVEIFTSTCFSCLSSNYSVSLSVLVDLRGNAMQFAWGPSKSVNSGWPSQETKGVPTEPAMSVFIANSLYLSIERFNQPIWIDRGSLEANWCRKLHSFYSCSNSSVFVDCTKNIQQPYSRIQPHCLPW